MADYQITMVRGDTLSFGLVFDGLDQDLDSAFFTVKKNETDGFMFQKRLGSGITKQDNGKYVVRIAPADTRNIDAGYYHFDLEITANGDVFTIMIGILEVIQDITV